MDMKKTARGTKKFTKAEKLKILKEAKKEGVGVTLDKYGVYQATYYYWKKKFLVYGEEGLDHRQQKGLHNQIKKLEEENKKLKELLGKKELESEIKDELLKKKYPELRRKI